MNKLNILFLGGLIAVGMVACDDKLPVAPPQANEQGPVLEEFTGASASLNMTTVDLQNAIANGDEYITLYSVNSGTSGLSQNDIWGKLEVSNSQSFERSVLLNEVNGMVGTVNVKDLNEAHLDLFGYSPAPKDVYYRIPLYATVQGNDYRIGSLDYYGAVGTYSEICDPGYYIAENYYIIGVDGWNPSDAVPMNHADGVSAYDDPEFTYSFSSEGTTYWKIVPPEVYDQVGGAGFDPDSDFWPNIYSVVANDGDPFNGKLEIANAASGEIPAGSWTIKANMKNLTYTVTGTPAGRPEWVGTPNDSQGWNTEESMQLLPYGENYKGFSYFGGQWGGKLAYTAGGTLVWMGLANGFEPVPNNSETDPAWEVQLSPEGGNIFEGVDPKMYFINYLFTGDTATFHQIISTGIIGGFNEWAADEPMTEVEGSNGMKWSLTYTFDSNTSFKFRFNGTWEINLGGDLNELTFDGPDLSAEAGTYDIVLDITNVPYKAILTEK